MSSKSRPLVKNLYKMSNSSREARSLKVRLGAGGVGAGVVAAAASLFLLLNIAAGLTMDEGLGASFFWGGVLGREYP